MADASGNGSAITPLCGARTRSGETCRNVAGYKTGHVGEGKCFLHGGLTPIKHGRYSTVRHTRINELTAEFEDDPDPLNMLPELAAARALFVDYIERYETYTAALLAWHESWDARSTPLPEDKVMAFERVVDEWEDQVQQLGESATERQLADIGTARKFCEALRGRGAFARKPRQVLDIADAHRILDTITKVVERIEKIHAGNAISRSDFLRLTSLMGAIAKKHVTDLAPRDISQEAADEVCRRIANEWGTLAAH